MMSAEAGSLLWPSSDDIKLQDALICDFVYVFAGLNEYKSNPSDRRSAGHRTRVPARDWFEILPCRIQPLKPVRFHNAL